MIITLALLINLYKTEKYLLFYLIFVYLILLLLNFLYLFLFSSPGYAIFHEDVIKIDEKQITKYKSENNLNNICYKCRIFKTKNIIHCEFCDICIYDYDHHCVWVGKCVGYGNLFAFNIFLVQISAFLIFLWLYFAITVNKK